LHRYGAVTTRLNTALDELRRAQQLASVGEYESARQLLRKGALVSVRGRAVLHVRVDPQL
jgi:hypothetical protein